METVNTLISQKTELQMSLAECERQVCIEKEKASQEAQHAAQAEADVRHVREVLDESLSGAVKRIAETMESFAK